MSHVNQTVVWALSCKYSEPLLTNSSAMLIDCQLMELRLGSQRRSWPTVVAFDPRQSRDHIAAAVLCHRSYSYFPRDNNDDLCGTTSVALLDFRSRCVLSSTDSVSSYSFRSRLLQYIRNGDQLLILAVVSFSHTDTSGVAIPATSSSSSSIVLLSSDDLSPIFLLPLCCDRYDASHFIDSDVEISLTTSRDRRYVSLVWRDWREQEALLNSEISRDSSVASNMVSCTMTSSTIVDQNNNGLSCDVCSSLVIAVYRVPAVGRTALPLTHLCAAAILKLVPRDSVKHLPVPLLLRTELFNSCQSTALSTTDNEE